MLTYGYGFIFTAALGWAVVAVLGAPTPLEHHVTAYILPSLPTAGAYVPPADIQLVSDGDASNPPKAGYTAVARIDYVGNANITGWDDVVVTTLVEPAVAGGPAPSGNATTTPHPSATPATVTDIDRYWTAGYLEGYFTQQTIYFWYLTGVIPATEGYSSDHIVRYNNFIAAHYRYLTSGAFNVANTTISTRTDFETQVGLFMVQIQGMTVGYNVFAGSGSGQALSVIDIFMLNLQNELADFLTTTSEPSTGDAVDEFHAFNHHRRLSPQSPTPPAVGREDRKRPTGIKSNAAHCSVVIRVTASDLFVAHTTWADYNNMFRQYKTYNVTLASLLPPVVVSLSGYPGMISSGDDWYVTSNYLMTTETTINVENNTLYRLYTVPETVSEFLRAMTANFLATSGQQWVQLFSMQNSGTYCNEWMVVDMKQFNPSQPTPVGPNTLWVADQIPGFIQSQDLSFLLREKGYFASYNSPYFVNIFNLTLNNVMVEEYGSLWSWGNYSRALIFDREAPKVATLDDVKRLIRLNNYKTDPYALIPNCTGAIDNTCSPAYSPCLAISCRSDLAPIYANDTVYQQHFGYQYPNYQPSTNGGIDGKVGAYSDLVQGRMTGYIVAGPMTENNPPFSWTQNEGYFGPTPLGMLDLFNYSWIVRSVSVVPLVPAVPTPVDDSAARTAVVTVAIVGCAVIVAVIIYVVRRRRAANSQEYTALR